MYKRQDVFCGDQKEILSYVHEKIPALFDKVFVCADTKSAFDTAVGIVKKNGCIALASAPEGRIEVPVGKLFSEQISIISGASQIPSSWYRALKILTETKDQLKGLTECRYDLEDWKEAIKACQNRLGVKILLKP